MVVEQKLTMRLQLLIIDQHLNNNIMRKQCLTWDTCMNVAWVLQKIDI